MAYLFSLFGEPEPGFVGASLNFNLNIKNPCFDTNFIEIDASAVDVTITDQTYTISSTITPKTLTHGSATVTQKQGTPANHGFCGSVSYQPLFDTQDATGATDPLSYTANTRTFSFGTTDKIYADNLF